MIPLRARGRNGPFARVLTSAKRTILTNDICRDCSSWSFNRSAIVTAAEACPAKSSAR